MRMRECCNTSIAGTIAVEMKKHVKVFCALVVAGVFATPHGFLS